MIYWIRIALAILVVWFMLGAVFVAGYNWAKYLYTRKYNEF